MKCELVECIENISEGMAIEDSVVKYPCQVALMGFFNFWTKECERAIQDIRIDRKAFITLNKRFSGLINRLTQILTRGTYKSSNVSLSGVQKIRLQCVIAVCIFSFCSDF